jgi:maleylacetoacetate isomerase
MPDSPVCLFDYFRSSASYRVRIALNLKGVEYEQVPVNLVAGEQRSADYRARNPQGLVPSLEIDGKTLTQSMSIVEYLDQTRPEPPLLPADPGEAAAVRAMAQSIASDIHPLNNLRVLGYLRDSLGQNKDAVASWYAHWVVTGFAALETSAQRYGSKFLSGEQPGLADVCLVPQMYNARRFDISLDEFPRLVEYDRKASAQDAFQAAHPDRHH